MSLSQDSAATIVCKEVFDETSHPSNEEVLDYAKRLGIDPNAEPHLLDLAREGLMAALPKGWTPCFHEASGAWYYYQASTGATTWEHPLDAVYKELVEQARSGNRQTSVEDDSKTIANDLESHEEASLPKEMSKICVAQSKIPSKLIPLRKSKLNAMGIRKRESSFERLQARKDSDESKSENFNVSSNDRVARDYTNLRFQDPKFYESPILLETSKDDPSRKELDLKEVLKRSESLSPRYEKDWEQLSSKFSSEENVIDIDKLNINSLTDHRSERLLEKFDKEKHPRQLGQQKELTLSGGGSMFLKSNKNKDVNSDANDDLLENLRPLQILPTTNETIINVVGERPKSILREKAFEDDERPVDEERKSVRFDLEKEVDIKFTYSASEDESDVESDERNVKISAVVVAKMKNSQITVNVDSESYNDTKVEDSECKSSDIIRGKENSLEKVNLFAKQPKIIGRRFVVENVSENEHFSQISKERLGDIDYVPSRFESAKNIDMTSKSESDSLVRSSDSKSSILEEIRRSKELMLENMKRSDHWIKKEMQREKDEIHHLMKIKHDLERTRHENETKSKLEYSKSFEDFKLSLSKEHEKEIQSLKIKFEMKLERVKNEMETNFTEQKRLLEQNLKDKVLKAKREMVEREEQEMQRLIVEMDKLKIENLSRIKKELEIRYEKEKQELTENLKTELNQKRKELMELKNQEMEKLEKEHEKALGDEKLAKLSELEVSKQHAEKIEIMKKDLEKEFDDLRAELRMQQREKISKITEDHEKCLAEILRDFRIEEGLARKVYKQRLEEIRADFSRDMEKEVKKQNERFARQESVDFEKIRCEKRLLEDKYKTLKEKYLKLKNDVRLAVERRSRRNEGNTTASETEKSTSARTRTDKTESPDQKAPLKKTLSSSKPTDSQNQNQSGIEESEEQKTVGFQKSTSCTKSPQKFESDDTTTASETNSNLLKKKRSFTKKTASTSKLNNNIENPVENIRKQLEKLEDLGDQLPSNETAYTLRYPFQDKAPINASSELEFFRHRIHVERDSVKRAREALRQQKSAFQGRQRAWKQRSARATLEQLVQEERELSDMEVSLHRTRSLLGEKVIHLRHLEQSLEKVANAKRNENDPVAVKNDELTLSDMSSASSGFSSTDLGTDTFIDKPDHYQESTEIIASLENLNSEIREIWGVLNKRQDNNIPPPPTLMYSDLGWLPYQHLTTQPNSVPAFGTPNIQSNILSQLTAVHSPTTTTQNIIAQYGPNSGYTTSVGTVERAASNLMERTRNLRDWLRQARIESTDLVSPGQATL